MKGLKNLRIRLKLIFSHGLIIFMTLIIAAFGLIGVQLSANRMTKIEAGPMAATEAVGDVLYATADLQRVLTAMIMAGGQPEYITALSASMEADVALMGSAAGVLYTSLAADAEAVAMVEQLGALIATSGEQREAVLEAINTGSAMEANTIYQATYRQTLMEIQNLATELKGEVKELSQTEYANSMLTNKTMTILLLGLTVLSLACGILLAVAVSNTVRKPIEQLVNASQQMQQGNLSVADEITYVSKDEVGELADSMRDTLRFLSAYVDEIGETLRSMAGGNLQIRESEITDFRGDFAVFKESLVYILDTLNATLSDIHVASEQLDSGAGQVAAGAQALSQGATEQAASVEELAATLDEINQKVKLAGEQAADTRENTNAELNMVMACEEQMKDMVIAMDEISRTSEEIGKIIKTIEDIAFQTNILALNAAVEAARAGAAGKGFAVVADEVRNLAAKSAEASQNTSALIEASVSAVQKGVKIVDKTAGNLRKVAEGARDNAGMVAGIADAAQELAGSIEQVSTGIDQISSVVQTNSATAEQSAAASEELSGQSAMLKELMNQFSLR